jgi:hypothetical protein
MLRGIGYAFSGKGKRLLYMVGGFVFVLKIKSTQMGVQARLIALVAQIGAREHRRVRRVF